MDRFVLKATPDQDLYCEWSTVVDAATFVGTRAEIREYLLDGYDMPGIGYVKPYPVDVDERLARADRLGSSMLAPPIGRWQDDTLIVEQRGVLRRCCLAAWLGTKDDALLEPFDDENEVRRRARVFDEHPRETDVFRCPGPAPPQTAHDPMQGGCPECEPWARP